MDNKTLPNGSKGIPLSGKRGSGLITLVDADDYDKLNKYRWFLDNLGYVVRIEHYTNPNGHRTTRTIRIHRVIMSPPADMQIDHRNRNKLDNRKSNLRICTASENVRNQYHKGYGFNKKDNRWIVNINVDGKYKTRSYKTEHEAMEAVKLVKSGVMPDKKSGHRNKYLPKYISRYMTKKGPRYYYRYVINGIVYRKCGFETISEAQHNLTKSQKGDINE